MAGTTTPFSMEDARRASAESHFWATRGKAIQTYALLEHSLCNLLAQLGQMPDETATTVFYKITSSRARDKVLEKLLKRKHGTTYSIFFNSFVKYLGQLAEFRNSMVHWSAITVISTQSGAFSHVKLVPAWSHPADAEKIDDGDLNAFIEKCLTMSRLATVFLMTLRYLDQAKKTTETPPAWLEICQQAVEYPPPSSHPLCRTYEELRDPLFPSQEKYLVACLSGHMYFE